MNLRSHPLDLLNNIEKTKGELKRITYSERKTVTETKSTNIFHAVDNFPNSPFYFTVSEPQLDAGNKATYKFVRVPHARTSVNKYEGRLETKDLVTAYIDWIEMLREYNKLSVSDNEKANTRFEEEFQRDYFPDSENDVNIFPTFHQQIIITNYIEYAIKTIEDSKELTNEEDRESLIKIAEEIKNDIPLSNASTLKNKFKIFFVKARTKSIKLCSDLLKDLRSALVKEGVSYLIKAETDPTFLQ